MGSTVGAKTTVQRITLISLAEEYAVERYPVLKSARMTGKGSIVPASKPARVARARARH